MKVKIGKYPTRLRCEIHTDYMNKKYGFADWPTEQSKKENFLEKLEDAIQSFYNILNRIYFDRLEQKVKVKIDRWDTWSMDHTLAPIIVPMLKQLKETKHGAPFVDDEDVPAELMAKYADEKGDLDTGCTDSNWFKRWDWVLDEMIWAFEQKAADDWEAQYYKFEDDPSATLGVRCVWSDDEGRKKHQARMSNGFRLFGKYYEALWD